MSYFNINLQKIIDNKTLIINDNETKIVHNNTFKVGDLNMVWFHHVHLQVFLQLTHFLFSKPHSKSNNEVSSDPCTQFPIAFCLQLERKSISNSDQVCIFYSSHNYCYVLFSLRRGNALLVTYLLTCLVADQSPSFFTYLLTISSIYKEMLNGFSRVYTGSSVRHSL